MARVPIAEQGTVNRMMMLLMSIMGLMMLLMSFMGLMMLLMRMMRLMMLLMRMMGLMMVNTMIIIVVVEIKQLN